MGVLIDITKRRFVRLVVQEYAGEGMWRCTCDCGGEKIVKGSLLRTGSTGSCGCLRAESSRAKGMARRKEDALRRRPEYGCWRAMINRCTRPTDVAFNRYAGRDITVCERWLASFDDFLSDVGPRPSRSHTLERVENSGNYEPGNVCWATMLEQGNNKRNNRLITDGDRTMTLAQWAREVSIGSATIALRLKLGWDVHQALTRPVRPIQRAQG